MSSWYEIEAAEAAEKAVAAFLQTEVANGNVSVDEAGSWIWRTEDAVWPIEVATDPAFFNGDVYPDDCEAGDECTADHQCGCCSLRETGYEGLTHAAYDAMVERVIASHERGEF